jgi:hypothetical protein
MQNLQILPEQVMSNRHHHLTKETSMQEQRESLPPMGGTAQSKIL